MKQCYAVKERHPVLPDRTVLLTDSFQQAWAVCTVKNGDSIKLTDEAKFYVGVDRLN